MCVAEKAATSLLNLPDCPMEPECQSRTGSPAGLDLGSLPAEAPCWACVESWGCGDSEVSPALAVLPQPGSDSASSPGSLTQTTLELNVPGLRLSPAPPGEMKCFPSCCVLPQEDEGFGDISQSLSHSVQGWQE